MNISFTYANDEISPIRLLDLLYVMCSLHRVCNTKLN